MGACMAPAAADVIYQHFKDFNSTPADYDKIITGDLGLIGKSILFELLKEKATTFRRFIWIAAWKCLMPVNRTLTQVEVAVAVVPRFLQAIFLNS